jgi:hypothetical protein
MIEGLFSVKNLQSAICNLQSHTWRADAMPLASRLDVRIGVSGSPKGLGQIIKHAPNLAQTPQLAGKSVAVKFSAAFSAA